MTETIPEFIVNDNGDYEWVSRAETPDIDVSPREICEMLNTRIKRVDLEKIMDARLEWQISRATGNLQLEHDKAYALNISLKILETALKAGTA